MKIPRKSWRWTQRCAAELGMGPYYLYRQKNMAGNFENVGYSTEGKAGLYNVLIMEEKQSIMAAGPGASTKFVFENGTRIERAENVKDLKQYIERIDEMLERKQAGIESTWVRTRHDQSTGEVSCMTEENKYENP